ncbi:MAG: outer membrane protein transport protein [Myxococcales bacterium]|jgi:long-subunit fatty acid transport protein|nr:outer membrane protein transport protein [Myxococcales bacterium]
MGPYRTIAAAGLATALAVVLAARSAPASDLLPPAIGAADGSVAGSRVADPLTPAGALFSNPAGLTGFATTTYGGSLGFAGGRGGIEASAPAGFEESNDLFMLVPDFGISIPQGRWRLALGSYGATGSTFDYGPDAAHGVPNFLSETIMMAFPLGVAYELDERLAVGAAVEPVFGQLRTHFIQEGLNFRYKVNGPGVRGMLGVSWRPTDTLAFGLGVRTPGRAWLGGSMPVAGTGRQDVDVTLKLPAQIFTGATWRASERVTLSASMRFTNSSTLGHSVIEYEQTPQANIAFVPDAKDEWKLSAAVEYAIRDPWRLRFGCSWASHIVGSRGANPLIFDNDDFKLSAGVGYDFEHWTVDLMLGYSFYTDRRIGADEALVFPGKYYMDHGAIVAVGLLHR